RRRSEVDPGDLGAALREPGEIDAGAATHFDHPTSAPAVKVYEVEQMVELFEMVLIEIVEEPARADGLLGDLQVVDVPVPVFAHGVDGRHEQTISGVRSRLQFLQYSAICLRKNCKRLPTPIGSALHGSRR